MRKGQVAYEFLFAFFFLTLGFTVWIIFTADIQEAVLYDKHIRHLNDVGLQVQEDLFVASEMPPGFSRTIQLPGSIANKAYKLGVYKTENKYYLIINSSGVGNEFLIPPTNLVHPFRSGDNVIKKESNVLQVNP